jgi:hypothetical protein
MVFARIRFNGDPSIFNDLYDIDLPIESNLNLANQNWNKRVGRRPAAAAGGGGGLILGDRQPRHAGKNS